MIKLPTCGQTISKGLAIQEKLANDVTRGSPRATHRSDWLKGLAQMVKRSNDGAGPEPMDYAGYSEWKNWDAFFTYSADDASYFDRELESMPLSGKHVLEIGFGEGRFLGWAKDRGALVTGMERDALAIKAAREHDIKLIDDEIQQHAQAKPDHYALIVAFDVFEHLTIAQIDDHLAAIAQLLEPGGKLVLRYPNGQSPFGLPQQHGDVTHLTALSGAKIEQLAAPHGLGTYRYAGSAMPKGKGTVRIVRWSQRLARRLIGKILDFVFNQNLVWDAVVTHVLHSNRPQDRR